MKKLNLHIVFIGFIILTFISCDNLLNEKPSSVITKNNFWQTQKDALAGVNAIYSALRYYGNMYYLADVSADQANNGEITGGLDVMDYNPSLNVFESYWSNIYEGINYANNVIQFVPSINMDEDLKKRYLGEAKFLRGLFYFDLVRAFGDIPKITKPTIDPSNNNLPRTDKEEIYNLIIDDLTLAKAALPISNSGNDIGRATKGAATALLAKVYLTIKKWKNARDEAKEIMDSGNYDLDKDFRNVFRIQNENSKEHIFSVQYSSVNGAVSSSFTSIFASRNPNITPNGIRAGSAVAAEQNFYDDFPDHYRKYVTMVDSFPSPNYPEITVIGKAQAGPTCMKYWDPNLVSAGRGDANWIILRYADVLLMFAEAENEVNGPTKAAYDAINKVRKRARDTNADGISEPKELAALSDISGLSKDEFRKVVWKERGYELCFEGHRRWDLLREGRFIKVMKAEGKSVQPRHTLFPIPLLEIQANPNLTQNPGYPSP